MYKHIWFAMLLMTGTPLFADDEGGDTPIPEADILDQSSNRSLQSHPANLPSRPILQSSSEYGSSDRTYGAGIGGGNHAALAKIYMIIDPGDLFHPSVDLTYFENSSREKPSRRLALSTLLNAVYNFENTLLPFAAAGIAYRQSVIHDIEDSRDYKEKAGMMLVQLGLRLQLSRYISLSVQRQTNFVLRALSQEDRTQVNPKDGVSPLTESFITYNFAAEI